MRRRLTAAACAAAVSMSLAVTLAPAAGRPGARPAAPSALVEATRALRSARDALTGRAPHADASMALLRLRRELRHLPPRQRHRAHHLLARPTDHPDPYGEAYHAKPHRLCSGHICIHWVSTTRDAPPSTAWVHTMLHMMNQVWDFEVDKLGYHRPVTDGTKGGGGSGRFDVYLKELFHQGLYGLTVAEQRSADNKHLYSSYLLLDNDFKRSQYHENPLQVARVTAAHEFFHAIQDAYDADNDPWLMEATATWMEDQFDDSSNDNRQYLPWSQLKHPGTPLDTYSRTSFQEYGNWVFFEYLSEHYGRGVVQDIWNEAAQRSHGGHEYSAAAIRSALRHLGGMTSIFGRYASGNTTPAETYAEGSHYPAAPAAATVDLSRSSPATDWTSYRVRHLASVDVRVQPGADLTGRGWRLQVKVEGPARSTMPDVVVLVDRRHHRLTSTELPLSRTGAGSVEVPFGGARTRQVTVTLANTSTRFRCHTGGGYSCNGTPLAPHPTFRLKLRATQR